MGLGKIGKSIKKTYHKVKHGVSKTCSKLAKGVKKVTKAVAVPVIEILGGVAGAASVALTNTLLSNPNIIGDLLSGNQGQSSNLPIIDIPASSVNFDNIV